MTNGAPRGSGGQLARAFVDGELRSRVHSGNSFRSTPTFAALRNLELLAALMDDIGAPCWGWGETAAALHRFDGYQLRPPFHVAVSRGRNIARIGHVVHTVKRLDLIDTASIEGLAVATPTRTLIELARCNEPSTLAAALDSAVRDGGTSEDFLHRRVVALRSRGRPGLRRLIDVLEGIEVSSGGHSWLEREFLRLVANTDLPTPVTQQVLGKRRGRLIRVDCRFPDTPVVVELLGYSFHRSLMQMQADAERMNQLLLDGYRPLQFTYVDVVGHASDVVATVQAALGLP
jgi:hypothetical protein